MYSTYGRITATTEAWYDRMAPITANPYAGPAAYARDLARLRELTRPHMPHPGAMIHQQALPHMNADDFAETIAILGPPRGPGPEHIRLTGVW